MSAQYGQWFNLMLTGEVVLLFWYIWDVDVLSIHWDAGTLEQWSKVKAP